MKTFLPSIVIHVITVVRLVQIQHNAQDALF